MISANWRHERELWRSGHESVVGLDEVGRGAWAGPVVSAAVGFPPFVKFPTKLYDSKLLGSLAREELVESIREKASMVSIGIVGVAIINRFGIGRATQNSFRQSLKNLPVKPDFILIDAFYVRAVKRAIQLPLKKGDAQCASIAAASIIAKVYRDNLLVELDKQFPQYGFAKHKGYGTRQHQKAIAKHSLSAVHRTSFRLQPYQSVSQLTAPRSQPTMTL